MKTASGRAFNPAFSPTPNQLAAVKTALFAVALIPLASLAYGGFNDGLGANPIEFVTRQTGTWTFNFLLITLTVTPLRALSGQHWLLRLRRMLGLFCFFYAALHFTTYLWLDQFFDIDAIARDIVKRPFITVGFAAFSLLLPLAATSSNRAIRRLGGKRWQALHRSVYLTGILAAAHYFWLVKATALIYPLIYAGLLAILLGWRAKKRIASYGPFPEKAGASLRPIRFFRSRP
ncbi:MAG: sulfoxide reductase heme-binding subunit YedZ [Betaproteobacteria bacterium]|nr:sulfoxide reductase heme-binding subunit YedZ [Betaproteobacteria bacterium]